MGISSSKSPPPPPPGGGISGANWHNSNHYHYNNYQSNSNNRYDDNNNNRRLLGPKRPRVKSRSSLPTSQTPVAQPTMPSFFSFEQGSERTQNVRFFNGESSPLLGRFRAVPRPNTTFGGPHRTNTGGSISSIGSGPTGGRARHYHPPRGGAQAGIINEPGWRGSVHVGYGAIVAAEAEAEEEAGDGDDEAESDSDDSQGPGWRRMGKGTRRLRRVMRRMRDTWVDPKAGVVRRLVDVWWSRWAVLVVLPASLAVAWCAIPFPQYPLPWDDDDNSGVPGQAPSGKVPGHGAARVQVNFWFFLFVYYSFYNLTALIWITKVFNIYSLNWWPQSLGFPVTVSAIAILSLAAPLPLYLVPEARWLTAHNTVWISWTFCIMAMPVAIAFFILLTNERHLGLRHSLSETQRIFTSSWWTGEREDTISRRERRQRAALDPSAFDPNADPSQIGYNDARYQPRARRIRRRWLPASFVRFVWFCLALLIGLLAYVIGEAYAEIYLRTLPHNNLETIVYVYGWISTVHLLDGLTGWILGGQEGERVGSYPLSWIFKLYFMLTYQTYVRALYARLRDPKQFMYLQILSSTSLIVVTPILMSRSVHWVFSILGLNGQSYGSYQKICIRNVFIRFMAENASMLAFLGSVVVLHFGANKDVYPYFSFDGADETEQYTFNLTFKASSITWACELAASFVVAGLIRLIYGVSVVVEGKLDFAVWPELLPTAVAVTLHVLQNMLFSIVRLQFR
ncbi:hypothetical protein QC762_102760 [Podospora pseudocomata]|uniref:Uncharacterized protein n=1 Tax=Podospora pseudocomata TaxID=2093779 RepID=A0ABR0GS15_9PEZI|nr:hypothetical protein QC762_102760 [Podospora pseudocomata]